MTAMIFLAGAAWAEEIVWWAPDWGQARAEQLIKTFQAANFDVSVKLEVTVANGLQNRIQVVLRSGSPPDIIDSNTQWVPSFANFGKLRALDDFAKDNIDIADLLPATVEAVRLNGKMYGLPYRAQTLGLIYNKALYREAGLDPEHPPQTWAEFTETAKKLTRKKPNGQQQYGMGLVGGGEVQNVITRLLPFIWMNGGSVLSADGRTAVVNQPAAVEALAFYTDPFTKDGTAPPSTPQNDGLLLRRLFDNGVIAQYLSGQYDIEPIRQEAPTIEIGAAAFPHPEGKETAGLISGWSFVIPSDGRHIAATLRFAKFLMQPDNMGFYTDTFPASQKAMGLPRFQDPLLTPFKDMLKFARPGPAIPVWVQIIQIMYDCTQDVLLKRFTPQQATDNAAKRIQGLLDRR